MVSHLNASSDLHFPSFSYLLTISTQTHREAKGFLCKKKIFAQSRNPFRQEYIHVFQAPFFQMTNKIYLQVLNLYCLSLQCHKPSPYQYHKCLVVKN